MPDLFDHGAHVSGASSLIPGASLGAPAVIENIFEGAAVRIVLIEGEPWFVGKDVAERLGYADPTNAMKQHCRGVVKRHPILDVLGRTQEARILSEPDVLRLIVGSKLPAAERFERWIFENVLPSIRRTGSYGAPAPNRNQILAQAVLIAQETIEQQAAELDYHKPRSMALDRLAGRKGAETVRDSAKALGLHQHELFEWLGKHRWAYKAGNRWRAFQSKIDAGYLIHREVPDKQRDDRSFTSMMITPKGRARIAELLEIERQQVA